MLLLLNTDCGILHCVTVYVQPRNIGYNKIHCDNEVRLVFMNIILNEIHCVVIHQARRTRRVFLKFYYNEIHCDISS